MANFNFMFTIECPHCGRLFEVSHFAIEVLFSNTELGICPGCGLQVTAHLTSRAVDKATWESLSPGGSLRSTPGPAWLKYESPNCGTLRDEEGPMNDYHLIQDRNCAKCARLVAQSNMVGDFCYHCSAAPPERCVRCGTDAGRQITRALSGKLLMLCGHCGENYIAAPAANVNCSRVTVE